MAVRYLFNTAGEYVAFAANGNVFSPKGQWLGFVHGGNQFYSADGRFTGYILEDDRVARKKGELRKPRVGPPPTPPSPLMPLNPLRRLRKPKLPPPYEDVFEHGVEGDLLSHPSTVGLHHLEGSELLAADGTFLGRVSRNSLGNDSLTNEFGPYGNPYSASSIFNNFGQYGNSFSPHAPGNEFSRTPPRFVKGGRVIAYLTANQFIAPRVDPLAFKVWLKG
jgi:hypothetical protein